MINDTEQKIHDFLDFVKKENPDFTTLKNRVIKLEQDISLYKRIKNLKQIIEINDQIIFPKMEAMQGISKLNTWIHVNPYVNIYDYENFPKPSYKLVFDKNETSFFKVIKEVIKDGQVSLEDSEYENLLTVSEKDGFYKVEVFRPGEWVNEVVKCLNFFDKEFENWMKQTEQNVKRLEEIVEKGSFTPYEE